MKIHFFIIICIMVEMDYTRSLPTDINENNATDTTALALRLHDVKREKRQTRVEYYDFLITEASFKFWTVLEVVTCIILLYSTFAAIYYARFVYLNPSQDPDKDYEADLLTRRDMDGGSTRSLKNSQNLQTLINILQAITKPPQNILDNDFDTN